MNKKLKLILKYIWSVLDTLGWGLVIFTGIALIKIILVTAVILAAVTADLIPELQEAMKMFSDYVAIVSISVAICIIYLAIKIITRKNKTVEQ